MYRRRQLNKTVESKPKEVKEEVKEQVKEQVKEEPKIKAIIVPKTAIGTISGCPMLNTLRSIDYFSSKNTDPVEFKDMVDILFSEKYLNVISKDNYWKPDNKTWSQSYSDTTSYVRNTFLPGDVIYMKGDNLTVALIITKVYSRWDGIGGDSTVKYELDYQAPGDDAKDSLDEKVLSTFTACDGTVFAFTKNTTFYNIKEYASEITPESGNYRMLVPTNLSKHVETTPEIPDGENWTNKKAIPDYKVKDGDLPVAPTGQQANKYNITTGITVEGWMVYMRMPQSEEPRTTVSDSDILGDVVKTGPIIIATVGENLTLASSYIIPFVPSPIPEDDNNAYNLSYSGNDTKFVSEPLNSDQYQINYGDTMGSNKLELKAARIYSLTQIWSNAGSEDNAPAALE
jgi:hypothetical protein